MSMFDRDVTTWSSDGRIIQLEYACKAVEQGSAIVGVIGKGVGVLAALQRRPHELAGYQRKIVKVDDHVFMGFSGLSADARKIHKQMLEHCLDHRYSHGLENGMPPLRLAREIASDNHWQTITMNGRPVGVGVLLLGIKNGQSTLNYIDPTGEFLEYQNFAIGKRCQSARTYLEKLVEEQKDCTDLNTIITQALRALNNCFAQEEETELTNENTVLAVVSTDEKGCRIISGDDMAPFLENFKEVKADEDLEDKDVEMKDTTEVSKDEKAQ